MIEKDWIDILTALLTPTIAIAIVIIAYLQWRTSEEQRKQQLFDKRYRFFKVLWNIFCAHIESPGQAPPLRPEDLFDYTHEADFLFGKDIVSHLLSMPEKQKENCIDYDWFSKPFSKYMKLK